MHVRCDALWKQAELRITLSLGHIAKHLIVSAIFLNDVQAVFNGRFLARFHWYRIIGSRNSPDLSIPAERTALIGLARPGGQMSLTLVPLGQVDNAQRPSE